MVLAPSRSGARANQYDEGCRVDDAGRRGVQVLVPPPTRPNRGLGSREVLTAAAPSFCVTPARSHYPPVASIVVDLDGPGWAGCCHLCSSPSVAGCGPSATDA